MAQPFDDDFLGMGADDARSTGRARELAHAVDLCCFSDTLKCLQQVGLEDGDVVLSVVSEDPSLMARLLGAARAAGFSDDPRASLRRALLALGPAGVAAVVRSCPVLDQSTETALQAARLRWAATAEVARFVASYVGLEGDAILAAAMTHDVGQLAFRSMEGSHYDELLEPPGDPIDATAHQERERYGCDHGVLGAAVLERLGVAPWLRVVSAWHHAPGLAYSTGGDEALLVAVLRIAEPTAMGLLEGRSVSSVVDSLRRDGAAAYLELSPHQLKQIWIEVAPLVQRATSRRSGLLRAPAHLEPATCAVCHSNAEHRCNICELCVCRNHRSGGLCVRCDEDQERMLEAHQARDVALAAAISLGVILLGRAQGTLGIGETLVLVLLGCIAAIVTWVARRGHRRYAFARRRTRERRRPVEAPASAP